MRTERSAKGNIGMGGTVEDARGNIDCIDCIGCVGCVGCTGVPQLR